MERPGGDEQDVIGLDHPVFSRDGAALDQRQQIALYAFARYICADLLAASGHLVELVEKHDSGLLDGVQCLGLELVLVDQLHGFLFAHPAQRVFDAQARAPGATVAHVREHALQLAGHFLHPGRRHDLHAQLSLA